MRGYYYYNNNLYAEKEDGSMYVLGLDYNDNNVFTGTTGHLSVNPIDSDLAVQAKRRGTFFPNFSSVRG